MKKLLFSILTMVLVVATGCTTTHSFSLTADTIEQPSVSVSDSTQVIYPTFKRK